MRMLVTGHSGMLGRRIAKHLSINPEYQVIGISRGKTQIKNITSLELDLTKSDELLIALKEIRPDFIIHTAALVDVDACETNKEYANNLHIESTRTLLSHNKECRFIYISTDSVFDGKTGNYSEDETPNPLNHYALSKWEGEKISLSGSNSLVLRTNIYGMHEPRSQGSLAEWALGELENENIINGFTNIIFNPLYTAQVACILPLLLKSSHKGILNLGSDIQISKFTFLQTLARTFGLNEELIKPVEYQSSNTKAKRPENTSLDNSKIKTILPKSSFDLEDGLAMMRSDTQSGDTYCS